MLCHMWEWMPLRATTGLQESLQWPSRRDNLNGSDPPEGVLRKCELRSTPAPAPGSKKGGSLPSTSVFPVRAPASGNLAVTTSGKGRSGKSPV